MNHKKQLTVVSLYPAGRGLGFCVFDTPRTLIDWGYSDVRADKTAQTLKKVESLIKIYQPKVIVLEDPSHDTSNRVTRIKKMIVEITDLAIKQGVEVRHFTASDVRQAFPVANKEQRARDIVKVLPELEPDLPPERQAWDNQHPRMQIFDAVALAITYFYLET